MDYSERAWVKAMKAQEVLGKAVRGEMKWYQAAAVLGVSPRQLRRMAERWREQGQKGLFDRRCTTSPKRASADEVETVLRLYREQYFDFNVKHFHQMLVERHQLRRGYTWTKGVLQTAGLVERTRKRGTHRRRRPRRPMVGMMLHLDGSTHRWLGEDGPMLDLLAVMDDASSEVYALHLVAQESTETCMAVVREVVEKHGVFSELYTDRGSHFCYTPEAGKRPDTGVRTELGRALDTLGIRQILANSPEARGRSERLWDTLQGRLPQELRLAGATTVAAAQRYIDEEFLSRINKVVQVAPTDAVSAFVPLVGVDLDRVFCVKDERTVERDNTLRYQRKVLQIAKSRLRATYAGCRVLVERLPDGRLSVWYGPHLLGRYDEHGCLREAPPTAVTERVTKAAGRRSGCG